MTGVAVGNSDSVIRAAQVEAPDCSRTALPGRSFIVFSTTLSLRSSASGTSHLSPVPCTGSQQDDSHMSIAEIQRFDADVNSNAALPAGRECLCASFTGDALTV
jgi:hypothetical protein